MDPATVLIWVLRIVLPVVLFWIYFRLQPGKDDEGWFPGPTGNRYRRDEILQQRRAPEPGAARPPQLETLLVVTEEQAPLLFAKPQRVRKERVGDGGEKDKERQERREKREKEKKEKEGVGAIHVPEEKAAPQQPPQEDKMHLESLLNYVAFNRKEQQRTFLPDEGGAPPPPPPRRPPATDQQENGEAARKPTPAVPTVQSEQANLEAQMVLRGAIGMKCADVAHNLYQQLADSQVDISAPTFMLMIEAYTGACDLPGASDMIMKMEAAGHCPDSKLLDKVMDLYSKHKEKEKAKQNAPDPPADKGKDDSRARLSPSAPIFVPMSMASVTGQPPPPPPPPICGMDPLGEEDTPIPRTTLSASAQPFQPWGAFDVVAPAPWGEEDVPNGPGAEVQLQ